MVIVQISYTLAALKKKNSEKNHAQYWESFSKISL